MKTLFLTIACLLATLSYGQLTESADNGRGLWISAKLYPSLAGHAQGYQSNEFYSNSSLRFTLSGGVDLRVELKKDTWYFETGATLFDWGFKETGETEDDPVIHSYQESYLNLTIPVAVTYRIKRFEVGAGVNVSYLLNHSHTVDGVTTNSNSPTHFSAPEPADSWLLGAHVKVGMNVQLTDKLNFRPEVYTMLGQSISGLRKFWQPLGLYSYGLGLGLEYQLK